MFNSRNNNSSYAQQIQQQQHKAAINAGTMAQVCSNCNTADYILSTHEYSAVCGKCGIVVDDQIIDFSNEVNFYEAEDYIKDHYAVLPENEDKLLDLFSNQASLIMMQQEALSSSASSMNSKSMSLPNTSVNEAVATQPLSGADLLIKHNQYLSTYVANIEETARSLELPRSVFDLAKVYFVNAAAKQLRNKKNLEPYAVVALYVALQVQSNLLSPHNCTYVANATNTAVGIDVLMEKFRPSFKVIKKVAWALDPELEKSNILQQVQQKLDAEVAAFRAAQQPTTVSIASASATITSGTHHGNRAVSVAHQLCKDLLHWNKDNHTSKHLRDLELQVRKLSIKFPSHKAATIVSASYALLFEDAQQSGSSLPQNISAAKVCSHLKISAATVDKLLNSIRAAKMQ